MVTRIGSAGVYTLLFALTLVVLICPLAMAVDPIPQGKVAVLELDPAKTTIAFSLAGWPHDTHGTFKLKRGLIRIYPATGKMDGSVIVDPSSGNSGEPLRDARMTSSILESLTLSGDQLRSVTVGKPWRPGRGISGQGPRPDVAARNPA